MKRSASDRYLNNSTPDSMKIDGNGTEAASLVESKNPGNVHLLENMTLADIAASNLLWNVSYPLESFLKRGEVPSFFNDTSDLAHWIVEHQQARLLNRLLGIAPAEVRITDQRTADGLLAIMRSELSFSGLTIQLDTAFTANEVIDNVLAVIAQAFQSNPSLIIKGRLGHEEALTLRHVLEQVSNLIELNVDGNVGSSEFNLYMQGLEKNRSIKFVNLLCMFSDPKGDIPYLQHLPGC